MRRRRSESCAKKDKPNCTVNDDANYWFALGKSTGKILILERQTKQKCAKQSFILDKRSAPIIRKTH